MLYELRDLDPADVGSAVYVLLLRTDVHTYGTETWSVEDNRKLTASDAMPSESNIRTYTYILGSNIHIIYTCIRVTL